MSEKSLVLELVKRVVYLLVALVLILSYIFVNFFIVPGDPSQQLTPRTGDPGLRNAVIEELKLNESVIVQYANFMVKMLSGEFFISTGVARYVDIEDFIYGPAGRTLLEFGIVLVTSMFLGLLLGRFLSRNPRSFPKRLLELMAVLAFAAPPALLGERLMMDFWSTELFEVEMRHVVGMIVVVMSCVPISTCGYLLMVRSTILERLPPVLDRRGAGLVPSRMGIRDMLPHLSPITFAWTAWTMACVTLVEIPATSGGLGTLAWDAVYMVDLTVLMVSIFLISLIVLVTNFALGILFLLASHKPSPGPVPSVGAEPVQMFVPETPTLTPVAEMPKPGLMKLWSEYRKSTLGVLVMFLLLAALVVALAAPLISTVGDPNATENLEPNWMPDDWRNPLPPSLDPSPHTGFVHPFGTDAMGRDVYSMMLYGAQSFLVSAFAIVAVSLLVGTFMWLVAQGVATMSRPLARIGAALCTMVADAAIAIPLILLVMLRILSYEPEEFLLGFIVFGVVIFSWAFSTKKAIAILSSESGTTSPRQLPAAGAPRLEGTLIRSLVQASIFSLQVTKFVAVIGLFSLVSFEFIGMGVPTDISWGNMLHFSFQTADMYAGSWWTYVFPGTAVLVMTAAIYVFLDALEGAFRRMITPAEAGQAQISPSSSSPQAP